MEADMPAERSMNEATEEEEPFKKGKGKPEAPATAASASSGGFDCNICLDFAAEPVVTLCGHLYCWPCLYKWLQQAGGDGGSFSQRQQQCCPVCKAALSRNTVVPLYGRGHGTEKPHRSLAIPRRPSAHREGIEPPSPQPNEEQQPQHQHQRHHYLHDYMSSSSPLGTPRVFHPTAGGVLGGMAVAVLPLIFRDQQWASIYYSGPYYSASYGGSPRLRQRETEVERSLHEIWVFLFCCAIFCLLLF